MNEKNETPPITFDKKDCYPNQLEFWCRMALWQLTGHYEWEIHILVKSVYECSFDYSSTRFALIKYCHKSYTSYGFPEERKFFVFQTDEYSGHSAKSFYDAVINGHETFVDKITVTTKVHPLKTLWRVTGYKVYLKGFYYVVNRGWYRKLQKNMKLRKQKLEDLEWRGLR